MLALLFATTCAAAAPADLSPAPSHLPVVARADEGDALKAAAAWLKLYRKGRILIYSSTILRHVPLVVDWTQPSITPKQSIAVKYGLVSKYGLSDPTWLGDLELIAAALASENTAATARALLDIAAVGLDDEEYVRELAPDVVRAVGEKWAAKLTAEEALTLVATAAAGTLEGSRSRAVPTQCAALRCLGTTADPRFRTALEPALAHDEAKVRFHAAEALARLADEKSAPALTAALERESSEIVLPALADALRSVYQRYLPELPRGDEEPQDKPAKAAASLPRSAVLAARAAVDALGRSTWRADMALLRFLDDFRTKDAVPALIGILERFHDHPEQVQSGKLSTLVLHRAHELLVSMTSAVFPASEPAKWRELWERSQDELVVQERRTRKTGSGTVASGFAGIPVLGSRVLFILDLSGSMNFPMTREARTRAGNRDDERGSSTRIDFARRELYRAVDGLAPNQSFNLITFDGDEKAAKWNKSMVAATNRNREKLKKYVDSMDPDGGTNLWSGLEEALKTKSLVYGDRYETNVDEIFILSDGAPTVGEVLDPVQILRLAREANRFAKMRINTVFISSVTEAERQQPKPEWMTIPPEQLMRRLAEENGGKCVIL